VTEVSDPDLARFVDRFTIEYVRVYPHPIERVWRAITDPGEFGVWFISGVMDAHTGGSYRFGGPDMDFSGPVIKAAPPTYIRFGGPAHETGYFQYELSEVPGGTRMRFTQHFPPGAAYDESPEDLGGDLPGGPDSPWKPAFVGGWHQAWEDLLDFLDGVPIGSRLQPTEFGDLAMNWANLARLMGELTAEQAERYARSLRSRERWAELNKIYRDHIRASVPG
jgi:uncharacterized protein YndB with AHSA1/START domain